MHEDRQKPRRSPPPPPKREHEEPSSKIKELNRAIKGYAKSYEVEIHKSFDPLYQLTRTKELVLWLIYKSLKSMKGLKFIVTLKIAFEMCNEQQEIISKTAYFNSKAETITNDGEIEHELSMSHQEIIKSIEKWISNGSGWIIRSIDGYYINVVAYQPLNGSSYIDLPTELINSKNEDNEDNECFRWCHIRYLNPQKKILRELRKMTNNILERWIIKA